MFTFHIHSCAIIDSKQQPCLVSASFEPVCFQSNVLFLPLLSLSAFNQTFVDITVYLCCFLSFFYDVRASGKRILPEFRPKSSQCCLRHFRVLLNQTQTLEHGSDLRHRQIIVELVCIWTFFQHDFVLLLFFFGNTATQSGLIRISCSC